MLAEKYTGGDRIGLAPLHGPIDLVVPEFVGDEMVQVLTEALSNAARHAHASSIDVMRGRGRVALLVLAGRTSGISVLPRRATAYGT